MRSVGIRIWLGAGLLAVGLPALSANVQIVGDNSAEVQQHAKLKEPAGRYIQTLDAEVKRVAGMAAGSIDGASAAAISRKFAALKQQGEQFGPALGGPLNECLRAGISGRMVWDVAIGFIKTSSVQQELATYQQRSLACREQIAKPPKAIVSLKAAAGKPPFKGCLRVLSPDEQPGQPVTWTCPKAGVKS